MKKYMLFSLSFMITILIILIITQTNYNQKGLPSNTNELGGSGELENAYTMVNVGEMYDDENIYFLYSLNHTKMTSSYIKLTTDGQVLANCNLATCNHYSTGECEALAYDRYFRFGTELYKYKYCGNTVKSCRTDENVFTSMIPEELKDEDVENEIDLIIILNSDYIVMRNSRFGYIVDKDFNIIYTMIDIGKWNWFNLYNGKVYYVNDIEEMVSVNIETGERKIIEKIGNKILYANSDKESSYIFYISASQDLYRYSLKTEENEFIKENVGMALFSVTDKYLYYQENSWDGCHKEIWDYNGNLVKDCTDCTYFDMEKVYSMKGKIYSIKLSNNLGESYQKLIVTSMNSDGSDYQEYTYQT